MTKAEIPAMPVPAPVSAPAPFPEPGAGPSRPSLLLIYPLQGEARARLERLADVTTDTTADLSRIEIVVTGAAAGLPRAMLDDMAGLRLVSLFGIGLDGIDMGECARRGIDVACTCDAVTNDVADTALLLLLAALRDLLPLDRFVRDGTWAGGMRPPLSRSVSGRRLGIFGLGAIGRAIAARAAPFGMDIAYHNRRPARTTLSYHATLGSLADWADVLVIAVPGGPQTRHAVDDSILERLGPDGVVINIARGSVVDEEALARRLRDGRVRAAGLDVFANEPVAHPDLIVSPRTVLMPHAATATAETRERMGAIVVDNIAAYLAGDPLPGSVTRG